MEDLAGRVVISGHEPNYADPIRLKKGEPFELSGRTVAWEGKENQIWLWAICGAGRGGWIPDDFCKTGEGQALAPYDYDSIELKVVPGERLHVFSETHGWAHCKNSRGKIGWVPARVFY